MRPMGGMNYSSSESNKVVYYINFEIKCKRTIVQVTVELYCTFGLPRTPIKLLYSSGVLFGHSESELRFVYFVWFDCHQRHLNVE